MRGVGQNEICFVDASKLTLARSGMLEQHCNEDGIVKALAGVTTIEEVLRVTEDA